MSEKRFKSTIDEETMSIMPYLVSDNEEECFYNLEGCVDLLNEQQATISKQLDQIIELQDKYRILEFNHKRLEERNKKQYEKIGEQQATIRKLQDLCGQSDGENAKLRIKNNEQQTTIEQKDKQLEKAKEYFQDYLSKEMSADKFSEMWDLVIGDE